MTEIEKINSSELGQTIKQIMELLGMSPNPKEIWLIQYVVETASDAMSNMYQGIIPADMWTLEIAANLPLRNVEEYKALMQDEDEMGEEYWLPMFKKILKNLQAFLKEKPDADWDELSLENAWELADGPLGEMLQGL